MHPYKTLEDKAFWRLAVADCHMLDVRNLWTPKFPIGPNDKIATFGSCFAQHIGRALSDRGYTWIDTEPPPRGLSPANQRRFNFGVFTCRTGNIYTASLLHQWLTWAFGEAPPDEHWTEEGRVVDPFRPSIEPNGFETVDEMCHSRNVTSQALARAVREARVFVFTLGLTESWWNRDGEYEYPLCPGTAAGRFFPQLHRFENQRFERIRESLSNVLGILRVQNPRLQVLLTVSPVPLTATNLGRHVLTATTESKSILRAVAGEVADAHSFVDYFPSYEMICSPVFKGIFFEPNQRTVHGSGVRFVMDSFFHAIGAAPANAVHLGAKKKERQEADSPIDAEVVCEEVLLDAFGPRG